MCVQGGEILCGAAFLVPVSVFCDFKRAAAAAQKKEDLASVLLIVNTKNKNTNKNTNVDKYRLEFKTSNDDKTRITLGLEYSLQIFEKEQIEKSGFANILAYK